MGAIRSGPDQDGLVAGSTKPSDQPVGLILDPAMTPEVVRTDDADPQRTLSNHDRSDGQFGWKRCHWVGASRMMASWCCANSCVVA